MPNLQLTETGRDHFQKILSDIKNEYVKSNPGGSNIPQTADGKDFICRMHVTENEIEVYYNYSANFGEVLVVPQAHYDACDCFSGFVNLGYLEIV